MSQSLRSVGSLPTLPGNHAKPRAVRGPKHIDPTNKTQKTAMNLLKREELNAKRSRLEALLSQQFIAKYGGKRDGPRINAFIKATISDFVHHFTDMDAAEGMIDNLEAKIREITKKMREDIAVEKEEAQRDKRHQAEMAKLDLHRQASGNGSRGGGGPQGDLSVEASWAVLNALKVAEADEKEAKKQADAAKRRADYKTQLDAQRDYLRSTRNDNGEQKAKDLAHNKRVAAEYQAELITKEQLRKEKGNSERELRMLQIQANNEKREQERHMKILAEKADMARSRRLAEEEKAAVQHKKDMSALRVEQVKLENERNKAIKEEAKRKQWEYEAKLNRDYEAKLDKEERDRQAAFQKRLDALKKFEKGAEGLAAAAEAASTAESNKTMAEIEKKYEADAQKLKKKAEDRHNEIVKSRAFNMTLIERKQQKVREEREADIKRRQEAEKALQDERARDATKKANKYKQMAELKKQLDDQVHFRETTNKFQKNAGLSAEEAALNKRLITKIESDPALYQKVMAKVNPTPRGGLADFKYG